MDAQQNDWEDVSSNYTSGWKISYKHYKERDVHLYEYDDVSSNHISE